MADNSNTQEVSIVEDVEEYSPEELALAQQELSALTPAEYLSIALRLDAEEQKEIEALKEMPEAGGIIFCELVNENKGYSFHLTARGTDTVAAIRNLARGIRFAKSMYGWKIKQVYSPRQAAEGHSAPPAVVTPPVQKVQPAAPVGQAPVRVIGTPVQQSQPAAPAGQSTSPAVVDSGTDVIQWIKVDQGKVLFQVGKFNFPFPDSRGAKVVASMFDANTGFKEEHFATHGLLYEPPSWGGVPLYADWEAVQKPSSRDKNKLTTYRNVVRVHF